MCIVPEELAYGKKILQQAVDNVYMHTHARRFNWSVGVDIALHTLKNNESHLSVAELLHVRFEKLFGDIVHAKFSLILNELLAYSVIDWLWCYPKRLQKEHAFS